MYKIRFFEYNKNVREDFCLATYNTKDIPNKGDLIFFSGDSLNVKTENGVIYKIKRVVKCYSNVPQDIDGGGDEMNTIEVDVIATKIGM